VGVGAVAGKEGAEKEGGVEGEGEGEGEGGVGWRSWVWGYGWRVADGVKGERPRLEPRRGGRGQPRGGAASATRRLWWPRLLRLLAHTTTVPALPDSAHNATREERSYEGSWRTR